jgi:hypothetical protein
MEKVEFKASEDLLVLKTSLTQRLVTSYYQRTRNFSYDYQFFSVFEHNDNKVITFLVGVECSSNETSPPTLENAMMNIKNVN